MAKASRLSRLLARLVTVQSLYQREITGAMPDSLVLEKQTQPLSFFEREEDFVRFTDLLAPSFPKKPKSSQVKSDFPKPDMIYFVELFQGTVKHLDKIDAGISKHLSQNWQLSRLDTTLLAILRAASFELVEARTTPIPIVIEEYVILAKMFFDEEDVGFVNALLDSIAKDLSPSGLPAAMMQQALKITDHNE